jgi:hypothetical protein
VEGIVLVEEEGMIPVEVVGIVLGIVLVVKDLARLL